MENQKGRQPHYQEPSVQPKLPPSNSQSHLRQPMAAAPPWLMREKVTIPERVAAYFERAELLDWIRPVGRRGTVLKAPGGFGKTTLLSEFCRTARVQGELVAWLTLDVQDAPQILEAYLALAFQEAGLDLQNVAADLSESPIGHGIENLLRAINLHGEPCVLVLDELERIADAESLDLISTLLKWGPPNLRFVLGCRELPAVLDIGSSVLSGDMALLDANDLRFSPAEIAGFLGGRRSRRELDTLAKESGGWPIAIRIARNESQSSSTVASVHRRDIAGNWVESRLWRELDAADRGFLLDVGLFERIDGDLLDEVLEAQGSIRRLQSMPAVAGLLESVQVDGSDVWRLHPLIREHCDRRRLQETPDRYRSLHQRTAEALARRGETVAAMGHAARAEVPELSARILEDTGPMRLWLREGTGRLQAALRLLTPETIAGHPRLALARCVVEITTGRLDDARQTYRAAVANELKADSPDTPAFEIEKCSVQGMLCLYGSESLGSELMKSTIESYKRFADEPRMDSAMRGQFEIGLCIAHILNAEFDTALHWVGRAERRLSDSQYIRMFADLYRGQIAMARGEVTVAAERYGSARRIARARWLQDAGQAVFVDVLMREFDLETYRPSRLDHALLGVPKALYNSGTPLPSFAAANETAAVLTLLRSGAEAAIGVLDESFEYALARGLPALVRCLGGTRVSMLLEAGRTDEAERFWRRNGLPEDDAACLDLNGQSWREMESLCWARLRLLLATEQFDAGRQFADSLFSVAVQRRLRRTWMRGLAHLVALEWAAGQVTLTEKRLVEFLELYAETDYALGAVLERKTFLPAIERLLRNQPDQEVHAAAERLIEVLRVVSGASAEQFQFTRRELQVLELLSTMQDKEIAQALDISVPGVRYHIARLFAKLEVKDRRSAVDRARQAGLLTGY